MPYYVGGKQFMSSALAKAASPGGYTRTTYYPGGNPYFKGNVSGGVGGGGVAPAASTAMQKAIAYYQEGGGFGKGTEAALERGRTKAVASGAQSLVSAGLAGTTMMAGLGKKFEEEVGAPTRARVEETRAGAISSLEMARAQIIQGATEADRSRALQTYLAELQSQPSMQGPTITARPTTQALKETPTPTDTVQKIYNFPGSESKSLITGRSPTASYYGSARF